MGKHKKSPLFIKIVANDGHVICINPTQLASFELRSKAVCYKVKPDLGRKPESKDDFDTYEADVINFYFPGDKSLRFEVGKDITSEEMNYISAALNEWVYLIRPEFDNLTRVPTEPSVE